MNTISMELHEEQITELQYQIEKLENEKHYLEEELEDLKVENEDLEDRLESYKKSNKTLSCICHKNLNKMYDMQKLNSKLVKNNKASNRDFFILAVAYAITLMIMIYLFIL